MAPASSLYKQIEEAHLENCILHYSPEVLWARQNCHLLLHAEFESLWRKQSNIYETGESQLY